MMTKLSLGVLLILTGGVFAADTDPGYGPRPILGAPSPAATRKGQAAGYFKPTMRYYGKGFTVAYRYVSWNDKTRSPSMTLESEQFRLPASSAQSMVGVAPRVTYFYDRKATPATPSLGTGDRTSIPVSAAPSPAREVPAMADPKAR